MDDIIDTLQSLLTRMNPQNKAEIVRVAAAKLSQLWLPNPGPQTDAYLSKADLLLYGGAAGGGKSSLLLGLATTKHQESVIFRRAYRDLAGMERELLKLNGSNDGYNSQDMLWRRNGRLLEFGALEKPGSEFSWQGRRHDFIGFDEGAQIPVDKVEFVMGWLASTIINQRCRAVIASNPPIAGEGDWLIEWFAPWLDPLFPSPAQPGELRWAINVGVVTEWVVGPGEYERNGKTYTAMSRTFIPALLDDNPFLKNTDYRARIENMREPLRSQLLMGDFLAGREDHEWQVIPSEWVKAANDRWRMAETKYRPMIAFATDVALGGGDLIVGSRLHEENWFAPLIQMKSTTDDPSEIASWMVMNQRDQADLSVDATGGWGSGVRSHLRHQHQIECAGLVFSQGSNARAKDGKHTFKNLRAEMWWRFYEALAPDSGEDIKLPVDPRLTAQLTSPHYQVKDTDILIEGKEAIRGRLGTSTDHADAVIMAWHRRKALTRRLRGEVPGLPKMSKVPQMPTNARDGWMMT